MPVGHVSSEQGDMNQQAWAVCYWCRRAARGVRFLTPTPAIGVSMMRGTLAGELPIVRTPPSPWNTPRCGNVDVHSTCDEVSVWICL